MPMPRVGIQWVIPSVAIGVFQNQKDLMQQAIIEEVKKELARLKKIFPEGIDYIIPYEQPMNF